MNWAEIVLICFGILTATALASYLSMIFFYAAWKFVVHWKRDYHLYSYAYGMGFQKGYNASRNDAGLPPLPPSKIPKERNVK